MAHEEDSTTWDIVRDLHFLIASDDQLQDELKHVVDLLTGDDEEITTTADKTTSEESDNSPKSKRLNSSKRKASGPVRFETRQKEEILQLQAQVVELKAQLALSQNKGTLTKSSGVSVWEKAARRELAEKNKSLRENEQLRTAMKEQATFIEHMQNVLSKKPRLSALPNPQSEAWKECKLAAQQSLREAAIHAIADRQYSRQQNAFINAGLFERKEHLFHSVYNGEKPPALIPGAIVNLDIIDKRTVYSKYAQPRDAFSTPVSFYSNTIHKYYVEEDRHVIAWRSVLEDALMPTMAQGNIKNEWGWIVAAADPDDPSQCRLSLLCQIPELNVANSPEQCVMPKEKVAEFTAFIEEMTALSIKESDAVPPSVCGRSDALVNEAQESFMHRGKLLELALQVSINHAIKAYQAERRL
ncbi:hypothetical protein Ae201684P_021405 [Aphanomyces euteiches]|nr:hypothetical protein Ae201684P_021405 [Aphanomyces euteiches]